MSSLSRIAAGRLLGSRFERRAQCFFGALCFSRLVALGFLGVALSCQPSDADSPTAGGSSDASDPGPERFKGLNVVVVLVDTLRADALGIYGYPRPTSPKLEERSAQWLLFEHCSAAAPWTLPSVSALMTSRHVFDHGVVEMGDRLRDELPVLAEVLSEAGYRTAAFTTNPFVGPRSGLDRGFESVTSKSENQHWIDLPDVMDWMSAADPRPFFAYLHSTEPHRPYQAPSRFVERFAQVDQREVREVQRLLRQFRLCSQVQVQAEGEDPAEAAKRDEAFRSVCDALLESKPAMQALYDGGAAWADDNFSKLLAMMDEKGLAENTIVLFLSDHGEELAEHGTWMHSQSLYEELLHVPMLWRLPGVSGTRLSEPVTLLDVTPTLLDLLEIDTEAGGWAGRSLKETLLGRAPATQLEAEVVANRVDPGQDFSGIGQDRGSRNLAVRFGSLKGVWNLDGDRFEVYDLASDPGETRDLSAADDDRIEQLRSAAVQWLSTVDLSKVERSASTDDVSGLSPRQRRRLIELGYLEPDEDRDRVRKKDQAAQEKDEDG